MVYALIYTLFLGFGLQIGSDLYLLFDPTARHHLTTLAADISTSATIVGTFAADNSTSGNSSLSSGLGPVYGTFTFTNNTNVMQNDIIDGCYRPKHFGWYLQPFPFWTQFLIVPLFSILSSLANLQPWRSRQLPVMVVISCASYASNKVANHYIFNRSDIVSAIGAFTVGLLGNVYSRKMGGTAFTSMVTGVLFLVPVGALLSGFLRLADDECLVVGPIAGGRHHSRWKRCGHWKCDDSRHNRYHGGAFHVTSACVHVRDEEECCCILVLSLPNDAVLSCRMYIHCIDIVCQNYHCCLSRFVLHDTYKACT